MSRTFYPSDEYDSRHLERPSLKAKRSWRRWLDQPNCHNDDDDDNPPTAPVAAQPRPLPPLVDAA